MPIVSNEKLEQLFEAVQNELAEKDAMIDWLAEQCKTMSENSWEYCIGNPTDWRKAAEEAVKESGKS